MARERIPVDISNDPELIRLTEEARALRASLVFQIGSRDVAILTPTYSESRRTGNKSVTEDDALFQLVGIGRSGIPGGVSGKKHEAIEILVALAIERGLG
jgi:hypothetical protein